MARPGKEKPVNVRWDHLQMIFSTLPYELEKIKRSLGSQGRKGMGMVYDLLAAMILAHKEFHNDLRSWCKGNDATIAEFSDWLYSIMDGFYTDQRVALKAVEAGITKREFVNGKAASWLKAMNISLTGKRGTAPKKKIAPADPKTGKTLEEVNKLLRAQVAYLEGEVERLKTDNECLRALVKEVDTKLRENMRGAKKMGR